MTAIEFNSIVKNFGPAQCLRDVSLAIAGGEFLTILGPSGCGKSTLLRVLAGLERQDSGTVSIGGRIVDAIPPKERDVAMVFQSYALYPHMTVARNMALPLTMRRLSLWQRLPFVGRLLPGTSAIRSEIDREVAAIAAALGIDRLIDRKPGQLSGGQRQRVALGRAMVRRPAAFLMDEPLSNLDAKLRVGMRAEIKQLHEELGITFVYVTHDQAEAMTLSDRVAVMADGELLQLGSPREIYMRPADRRVAEFIGSPKINMLPGVTGENGRVLVAGTALQLSTGCAPGEAMSVGIRAEAVGLAADSAGSAFTGWLRMIEHMGSDLFLHVEIAGVAPLLVARTPASAFSGLALGQTLHLSVDASSTLLFDRSGRRVDAMDGAKTARQIMERQMA